MRVRIGILNIKYGLNYYRVEIHLFFIFIKIGPRKLIWVVQLHPFSLILPSDLPFTQTEAPT